MIRAAFEKLGKWWIETAWPALRDRAWPVVKGAYAAHEPVRHAVTFAVGAFVAWAIS